MSGPSPLVFPFSALVGQEQMKLALCLTAVHPSIGGLLLRGQKGTAKSTAVRGLATLSSEVGPNAAPHLVNLPLGATEEMVVGTVDIEAALQHGEPRFLPGLLRRAHGSMLYIDEVNLLDDHLVDCILDAAESGINRVEREGLQISHPSMFTLVGSMNPEEGELRPQLLDRFALAVEVEGDPDPSRRATLMRRREQFDAAPEEFAATFRDESDALRRRLARARELWERTVLPGRLLGYIVEICRAQNVAGHRADLAVARAARAHAAWMGRDEVNEEDIQSVAPMALLHRLRDAAPPPAPSEPPPPPKPKEDSEDQSEESDEQQQSGAQQQPGERQQSGERQQADHGQSADNAEENAPAPSDMDDGVNDTSNEPPPRGNEARDEETIFEVGTPFRVRSICANTDTKRRCGSGRRTRSRSAGKHGRYVRSTTVRRNNDIALDATLRAAAPFQKTRRENASGTLAIHIRESDVREKIRERKQGNVLVFAVDGSGSMGAMQRMVETKGAIMSLLLDAYQKRDRVALVVFRGQEAEIVLPPTSSVVTASRLLSALPIGGRTPLSAGLCRLSEVLSQILRKDPAARPIAMLITDGKANAAVGEGPAHLEAIEFAAQMGRRFEQTRFIVVDTEQKGAVRLGLAKTVASALGADCFEPETLRAQDLVTIIKENF